MTFEIRFLSLNYFKNLFFVTHMIGHGLLNTIRPKKRDLRFLFLFYIIGEQTSGFLCSQLYYTSFHLKELQIWDLWNSQKKCLRGVPEAGGAYYWRASDFFKVWRLEFQGYSISYCNNFNGLFQSLCTLSIFLHTEVLFDFQFQSSSVDENPQFLIHSL